MKLETYEDVLNLQQQFADRLRQLTGEASNKLTFKTDSSALTRKQNALKQAQATLAGAEKARTEVLKRWDGDLARHRQTVAGLQSEITQLEQAPQGEDSADADDSDSDKGDRSAGGSARKKKK